MEVTKVALRNYVRIREEIPKRWPGLDHGSRKIGHLLYWNRIARKIPFQGESILDYKSELVKYCVFNWVPPVAQPGGFVGRGGLQDQVDGLLEVTQEDDDKKDVNEENGIEDNDDGGRGS